MENWQNDKRLLVISEAVINVNQILIATLTMQEQITTVVPNTSCVHTRSTQAPTHPESRIDLQTVLHIKRDAS